MGIMCEICPYWWEGYFMRVLLVGVNIWWLGDMVKRKWHQRFMIYDVIISGILLLLCIWMFPLLTISYHYFIKRINIFIFIFFNQFSLFFNYLFIYLFVCLFIYLFIYSYFLLFVLSPVIRFSSPLFINSYIFCFINFQFVSLACVW